MYAADGAAVRCSDGERLRSLGWSPVAPAGTSVPHGHPLVQEVLGRCRLSRRLERSDFGERLQRFVEEPVVLSDALMKLLGQRREGTVIVGRRPGVRAGGIARLGSLPP